MPAKVLIVDDEPNIVVSLQFLMRKGGFETSVARDGEEALLEVERFRPDLVLLDVMMPRKDGYEVCQQLRSSGWDDLKIVMLTAKGRESEITKGLNVFRFSGPETGGAIRLPHLNPQTQEFSTG